MLIALLLLMPAVASGGKKEEKSPEKQPRVEVLLKDGSRTAGKLTQDWFRWPAKSINENFKVTADDGVETRYEAMQVDSIFEPETGLRYTVASIPVPKLTNKNNVEQWIVECGPRSEHAEILIYVAWFNMQYGTRSQWEPRRTYCVRFGSDSTIWPFYYPPQNGEFNMGIMKRGLKDVRPEAVKYIEEYFKKNKKLRKQLPENPALFLEAYEEYLTNSAK